MTLRRRVALSYSCLVLLMLMMTVVQFISMARSHGVHRQALALQTRILSEKQHATGDIEPSESLEAMQKKLRVVDANVRQVARQMFGASMVLCAVAVLLSIYSAALFWRNFDRGMKKLHDGFESLASGVWDTVIKYPWRDEFGTCARHFNAMAKQLRDHARLLARLASRDPLTDLLNRRMFMEHLVREINTSRQIGRSMSLVMIDLDHFKNLNDRYGHAFGDRVLSHIGSRLRNMVRESDYVGRLGGEELAMLLPGADLDEAVQIAHQMRSSMACDTLNCGTESVRLSASFGVAQLDLTSEESSDGLLRRADRALYKAKDGGRDTVVADTVDDVTEADEMANDTSEPTDAGEHPVKPALGLDRDAMALIGSMFTMLHVMPDRKRVGTDLIEQVSAVCHCQRATLLLIDKHCNDLYVEASLGLPTAEMQERIPITGSLLDEILETDDGKVVRWKQMPPDILVRNAVMDVAGDQVVYVPLVVQGEPLGLVVATERTDRNPIGRRQLTALRALAAIGSVALKNCSLYTDLEEQWVGTIRALARAIDANDPYTSNHSSRVAGLAVRIGRALGIKSYDEIRNLQLAGLLHDVGKLGVPKHLLQKPSKLRPREYQALQTHSTIGAQILENIPRLEGTASAVLHHHEWYDGGGYPEGLQGDAIPLAARILGVADAFDAMTSERPYRKALSMAEAVNRLRQGVDTQFDPVVVDAFLRSFNATAPSELDLLLDTDQNTAERALTAAIAE